MKTKITIVSIVLVLSILIMTVSCSQQKAEWKGTIEEIDGVTIVKNPKEPIYSEDIFSLEEELTIGEKQGNEDSMFSEIIDVGVDDEENVYILDFKEAQIKVFNKDGEYLTTIGKRGQGPGEIQRPMNLVITPGGKILVNDRGARFLHYFKLSGEYIRSVRQTKLLFLTRPKVDSQNNIVARIIVTDTDRIWSFVLKKFDSELNELYIIFAYEYELSPQTRNLFIPDCFWDVA